MKKNLFETDLQKIVAHNGKNEISFARIFDNQDFQTNCHFVDYAVVPPGASIGLHRHKRSEEIYILIAGSALMTLNGVSTEVHRGDIIVNPVSGSHSLVNIGEVDVNIVVVEIGVSKLSEDH
jgi:mannose-6-phosphate isomerase-like protein (cupin superfamily)